MAPTAALMGIDLGQTRTKVLVVDLEGDQLGIGIDSTEADHPHPFWAERDLGQMWSGTSSAVRAALEAAGAGIEIIGVGVSGHSDGLYLVDGHQNPVRAAILATDARARRAAADLSSGIRGGRLLQLTGQHPMAASPAALLVWLRRNEPDAIDRSRWVLSSTDWLRLMLTGSVSTDVSMAAASWVALGSRTWSEEAIQLCGMDELVPKLPPIVASDSLVGGVTDQAGRDTGLRVGTPVAAGAHDVDTGALALGATSVGSVSVLLGTYSINQVLAATPVPDPRWQVRPFLAPDRWLHMSTSPAGAGCLDWAASRTGLVDATGRADSGAAVAAAMTVRPTEALPTFLPFVHGGPAGAPNGGAWVGLRGEHGRASMLRAVVEGVAFSHRAHLEALSTRLPVVAPIRVGGGGTRSTAWTQLLCDTVGLPVEVTASDEVSALGAALVAGRAVGTFDSLEQAVATTVRIARRHEPDTALSDLLDARYRRYTHVAEALAERDLDPPRAAHHQP